MKTWKPIPILIFLLFAACGAPPPPEPLDLVYRSLAESREELDLSCLAGKRIVIDPGHGGIFSGVTGLSGLAEKDANLGVALYLWGLLRDAGAEPFLTRATDRDFVGGDADAPLTADLAARIACADSIRPHLFLSIHHNAAADTNRSRNRVETYYRAGDRGPSLDAARLIHTHLTRNLGIEETRLLAGNFYVLRENRFPAVLGEPSYLSHPPMEEKLVLGEKRRLEAEAYFLGIVNYFSRGVPTASIDLPNRPVRSLTDLAMCGSVLDEPGFDGIDPASVRVTLDGKGVGARYDAETGRVSARLPADLRPGEHILVLEGRNLRGNAALRAEESFPVDFPPAGVHLQAIRFPGDGGSLLHARLDDARGIPVADGTVVTVVLPDSSRSETIATTDRSGLLISVPGKIQPGVVELRGEHFETRTELASEAIEVPPALLIVTGQYLSPLSGAAVWLNGKLMGVTQPGGWIALDSPVTEEDRITIEADRHSPLLLTGNGTLVDTVRLEPLFRAPLDGKRIVIDPAGFDEETPFPSASRNLTLALYLEEMVRWAGGDAILTRRTEKIRPERERIPLAERLNADYWITLDTGDSIEVRHYPGSSKGTPAARAIAEKLERAFRKPIPVRHGTEAVLRETPCPALRLLTPLWTDDGKPLRATMRVTAAAILNAFIHRIDPSPETRTTYTTGPLDPGGIVRVDDTVTFQSRDGSPITIILPSEGMHRIQMERNGIWKEVWFRDPGAP